MRGEVPGRRMEVHMIIEYIPIEKDLETAIFQVLDLEKKTSDFCWGKTKEKSQDIVKDSHVKMVIKLEKLLGHSSGPLEFGYR